MTGAPPGAGAQVARLLALVPYALTRREVRLEQAASDLGITPHQIVSDLKVLMYCGWPGYLPGDYIEVDLDALEGDGVIRVTNADYLARPLRLTVPEASALIVALRTLRDSADADVVPVVDRTLAKLEAAAEDGAAAAGQVDVHLGARERALGQLRVRLDRAVADAKQVELTYYVPARDERTRRTVDPLGLVTTQGMSYLDGWCHLAEDRRLFRLDRVEALEVLDTRADAHPDMAPRDLSAGLFQASPDHDTAVIRLEPGARWVAEYYPVTSATEAADGALIVELQIADPRWLQRLLLRLAPDATLLEPRVLAQSFTAAAQQALSLYT
ncbi:helix-turn-helix transcriptional regulator [Nocardioides sp.]|uniref:helix-turn-helix transcriptional regulator n=1 Tax=Nocardioides sp. TaxID=35761 RepID=UPI003D127A08